MIILFIIYLIIVIVFNYLSAKNLYEIFQNKLLFYVCCVPPIGLIAMLLVWFYYLFLIVLELIGD